MCNICDRIAEHDPVPDRITIGFVHRIWPTEDNPLRFVSVSCRCSERYRARSPYKTRSNWIEPGRHRTQTNISVAGEPFRVSLRRPRGAHYGRRPCGSIQAGVGVSGVESRAELTISQQIARIFRNLTERIASVTVR